MADFPPGYDPIQADYTGGSYVSHTDQAIGGLIGLSAFALISVGAFFTLGAAVAGTAVEEGITIGGTTYYGVTQAEAQILAAIGEGPITAEAAEVIATLGPMGTPPVLDAAAILALDAWRPPLLDAGTYGNFGSYMGTFANGLPGGGLTTPPGFPGFLGVGYSVGTGTFCCVKVNDDWQCHWQY